MTDKTPPEYIKVEGMYYQRREPGTRGSPQSIRYRGYTYDELQPVNAAEVEEVGDGEASQDVLVESIEVVFCPDCDSRLNWIYVPGRSAAVSCPTCMCSGTGLTVKDALREFEAQLEGRREEPEANSASSKTIDPAAAERLNLLMMGENPYGLPVEPEPAPRITAAPGLPFLGVPETVAPVLIDLDVEEPTAPTISAVVLDLED